MKSILISLLISLAIASAKITNIRITGKLTCHGIPIAATITMIDDNLLWFDHLLGYNKVSPDGKYYVHGIPEDDSLNVVLLIEHKCHNLAYSRSNGKKLDGYSEVAFNFEEISGGVSRHKDIELTEVVTRKSVPILSIRQSIFIGRQMVKDNIRRIKALPIHKAIFGP